MMIELLAFEDCPNASITRMHIAQAVALANIEADIRYIEIDTPELAVQHRFLGSPSVRINGIDVEPGAQNRKDFGLMCRTYENGTTGAPSVELIRASL